MSGKVVKVHVVYWAIKQALEKKFGAQVSVTGEGTPGVTGYLEVQIVGGPLLHSKKNGDGYVDTDAKMNKIIKGVEAALAAL